MRSDVIGEGEGHRICNILAKSIDDQVFTEQTRVMLRPCLGRLERAIEAICPAAMAVGPRGVSAAYGPAVSKEERLVVFATPNRALVGSFKEWPDLTEEPPDTRPRSWWPLIAEFVENEDLTKACLAFAHRLGPIGRASFDRQRADILLKGLTPICVVLAAVKPAPKPELTLACGISTVCCLLPALADQIDQIEAVSH